MDRAKVRSRFYNWLKVHNTPKESANVAIQEEANDVNEEEKEEVEEVIQSDDSDNRIEMENGAKIIPHKVRLLNYTSITSIETSTLREICTIGYDLRLTAKLRLIGRY